VVFFFSPFFMIFPVSRTYRNLFLNELKLSTPLSNYFSLSMVPSLPRSLNIRIVFTPSGTLLERDSNFFPLYYLFFFAVGPRNSLACAIICERDCAFLV